jgi:hypothetical protein
MAARRPAHEAIGSALHSCPMLCTQIGPKGLARFTTCSKSLKCDVAIAVCSEGLGLLDAALETARSSKQHKDHQAVGWLAALLLQYAPTHAAAVTERLLALPSVPLDCAERVVSAGMRISYSQLLAAADSMTAGAEVWVQAQSKLGIASDIPPAAVSICYGFHGVSGAMDLTLMLTYAPLQGPWCIAAAAHLTSSCAAHELALPTSVT